MASVSFASLTSNPSESNKNSSVVGNRRSDWRGHYVFGTGGISALRAILRLLHIRLGHHDFPCDGGTERGLCAGGVAC